MARERSSDRPIARVTGESILERLCKFVCVGALVVMILVIGLDILTRSLFNFSFEISDELGRYMLVTITFLSLPSARSRTAFITSSSFSSVFLRAGARFPI